MKKYIAILCLGLLLVTGCDKKDNTSSETTKKEETKENVVLTDELVNTTFVSNYTVSTPAWDLEADSNVYVYKSDNAIIAVILGHDADYKETTETALKNLKIVKSFKNNSSKEDNTLSHYSKKYTGTVELNDKGTKDYTGYEINDGDLQGYILGISKGSTKKEDVDKMIRTMVESINLNVI